MDLYGDRNDNRDLLLADYAKQAAANRQPPDFIEAVIQYMTSLYGESGTFDGLDHLLCGTNYVTFHFTDGGSDHCGELTLFRDNAGNFRQTCEIRVTVEYGGDAVKDKLREWFALRGNPPPAGDAADVTQRG